MNGAIHNVDRLAVFVCVVDNQSMTQAAELVCLSQPCISKYIKELEEAFGVPLLDRAGRRIVPTEAGRILYRFAKNLGGLLEDMDNAISEFRGGQVGTLTIGASTPIGTYLLPPVLGRFKTQHPGSDVTLHLGSSDEIYQQVENGDLQIGLTTGHSIPPDLEAEIFCKDEMVVVASPRHPLADQGKITVQQLAEEGVVHSPRGSTTYGLMREAWDRLGIKPRLVMGLDQAEALKRFVEEQVGVSLLCRISVARELASGALRELKVEGGGFWCDFNIVHHPCRYQSPIVRNFVTFLRERAPNVLQEIERVPERALSVAEPGSPRAKLKANRSLNEARGKARCMTPFKQS